MPQRVFNTAKESCSRSGLQLTHKHKFVLFQGRWTSHLTIRQIHEPKLKTHKKITMARGFNGTGAKMWQGIKCFI